MADIRTFDAADKLTQAAADLVLETAKEAVRDRGRFTLGLSGGATLAMLYRLLAGEPYSARMPWEQTFVFWCDERWVAATEPGSNQRMARDELLDRVAIPRDQIRAILTIGLEPANSAEVAQRHLNELFDGPARPDLVLLGMADDGHTAALFNASGVLLEDEALFAATREPSTDQPWVTATLALLNAARSVLFLVVGATKAYAVKQNLAPGRDDLVPPAGLVQPTNGKLTWLLDRDAAGLLPHTQFTSE